jgi:hypothetical protein
MKVTRRALAAMAAVAVSTSKKASSQTPAQRPDTAQNARAGFTAASGQLASFKLARNVEPATRFEP